MVAVPGGSKACGTCKKRRKGCDLRRPTCNRCEQQGLTCAGYDGRTRFVIYGTDDMDREEIVHCSSSQAAANNSLLDIPISLRTTALAGMYLGYAIPSFLRPSGEVPSFGWIMSLEAIHETGTPVGDTLMALVLSRCAHKSGDRSMNVQSYSVYNRALFGLSRQLQKPHMLMNDDTLGMVLLLALYETLQGSSNRVSSWISHIEGAARLVRQRGPEIQNTVNGRALFRDFRFHGLINAIGQRKSTFLSKLSWLGDPWQEEMKSDKDRLLDLMSYIPNLLEVADNVILEQDITLSLPTIYSMRNTYASLTNKLECWREATSSKRGTPWHSYGVSDLFTQPGEEYLHTIFPFTLTFADLETAEISILYWTAQVIVHGNFYLLYHLALNSILAPWEVPAGFPHLNPGQEVYHYDDLFDPMERECNIRIFVNNIAESLEYFLRPDMGVLAINMIVFPMSIAMAFLDFFHDRRLEYFYAFADKVYARLGVPLRDFLQEIPTHEILRLVKTYARAPPSCGPASASASER